MILVLFAEAASDRLETIVSPPLSDPVNKEVPQDRLVDLGLRPSDSVSNMWSGFRVKTDTLTGSVQNVRNGAIAFRKGFTSGFSTYRPYQQREN